MNFYLHHYFLLPSAYWILRFSIVSPPGSAFDAILNLSVPSHPQTYQRRSDHPSTEMGIVEKGRGVTMEMEGGGEGGYTVRFVEERAPYRRVTSLFNLARGFSHLSRPSFQLLSAAAARGLFPIGGNGSEYDNASWENAERDFREVSIVISMHIKCHFIYEAKFVAVALNHITLLVVTQDDITNSNTVPAVVLFPLFTLC